MSKKTFAEDDVWLLIHRMMPTEQRYFKVFASRHEQKGVQYNRLFDFLLKQDTYDEKALRSAFPKGNVAANKNYLSRMVLQSLRTYHDGKNVQMLIRDMQKNALILRQKRIYSASENELMRAIKLAETHEYYSALIELNSTRVNLLIEHGSQTITRELEEVYQTLSNVKQRYDLQLHLQEISDRIFHLSRSHYQFRLDERDTAIRELLEKIQRVEIPEDSLLLFHIKHKAWTAALVGIGDFARASKLYDHLIERWNVFPERILVNSDTYRRLLSNYLVVCHALADFTKMRIVLDKLHALATDTPEEEAEQFQNIYYMELLLLMNADGYDRLEQLVKEIEKGLKKYKTKINKARQIAFCHNISMAYFLIHDWKKSLAWIERIITHEKTEHRQDLQHTARMLRLVLWYELGKYDLLEYELVNVERFLRKRKAWFAYESTVVKFFDKLIATDTVEKKKLVSTFSAKLATAVEGKTSATLPGSSELIYWAKSKTSGQTMRELLLVKE